VNGVRRDCGGGGGGGGNGGDGGVGGARRRKGEQGMGVGKSESPGLRSITVTPLTRAKVMAAASTPATPSRRLLGAVERLSQRYGIAGV